MPEAEETVNVVLCLLKVSFFSGNKHGTSRIVLLANSIHDIGGNEAAFLPEGFDFRSEVSCDDIKQADGPEFDSKEKIE